MDEEEPKKLFSYRNPLYNKPSVPSPKVPNPISPIPHKELKAGEKKPVGGNPSRSGGAPPAHTGNTPVDHSQGDPSLCNGGKRGGTIFKGTSSGTHLVK